MTAITRCTAEKAADGDRTANAACRYRVSRCPARTVSRPSATSRRDEDDEPRTSRTAIRATSSRTGSSTRKTFGTTPPRGAPSSTAAKPSTSGSIERRTDWGMLPSHTDSVPEGMRNDSPATGPDVYDSPSRRWTTRSVAAQHTVITFSERAGATIRSTSAAPSRTTPKPPAAYHPSTGSSPNASVTRPIMRAIHHCRQRPDASPTLRRLAVIRCAVRQASRVVQRTLPLADFGTALMGCPQIVAGIHALQDVFSAVWASPSVPHAWRGPLGGGQSGCRGPLVHPRLHVGHALRLPEGGEQFLVRHSPA